VVFISYIVYLKQKTQTVIALCYLLMYVHIQFMSSKARACTANKSSSEEETKSSTSQSFASQEEEKEERKSRNSKGL
jgi:hypothetical protein